MNKMCRNIFRQWDSPLSFLFLLVNSRSQQHSEALLEAVGKRFVGALEK